MKIQGNYTYTVDDRKALHGFTLVELLVVIAIIALLLSILMPALGKVRAQAKVVVCGSQQRQLGLAMMSYMGDNKDHYPSYWVSPAKGVQGVYDKDTWVRLFQNYVEKGKADPGMPIHKTFYCPAGPVPGKTKWSSYLTGNATTWQKNNSFYVTYGYNFYAMGNNSYNNRENNVTPTTANVRGGEFLVLVDNAMIHNASESSGAYPGSVKHVPGCPKQCFYASRNHLNNMANVLCGDGHVASTSRKVLDDPFFDDAPVSYRYRNYKVDTQYPWKWNWEVK